MDNGLNQIGIKIDMYRQEHRFSPATPVFRRFDVQLAVPSDISACLLVLFFCQNHLL